MLAHVTAVFTALLNGAIGGDLGKASGWTWGNRGSGFRQR